LRFIDEAIGNVEQAVRWTAEVIVGSQATWGRSAVNLAVALLLISLALLAWRRLEFAVWGAWSAGRNERALRGPVNLQGLPEPMQVETRLVAALSATLVNMAMAATLLMALAVSVMWSLAPAWVNEVRMYSLLGQIAAGLFAVLMLLSFVAERVKEFFSLRDRWRDWHTRYDVTWPSLRAILLRIIDVALGLLIVWLVIDQLLTLPALLKPEIIFVGVLVLLRGLLALLDGIWQRLDGAGASTRTKVTLLMLPVVFGALAVTSLVFAPRAEPLQASTIISAVAFVGCIAAAIIALALRLKFSK
jgi:hypothetical protein